jgi:hypothetical protein
MHRVDDWRSRPLLIERPCINIGDLAASLRERVQVKMTTTGQAKANHRVQAL